MIGREDFERQTESFLFNLLLNIVLALVIFFNAELGRELGIVGQPLQISLVWPATGFSLAALLMFGYKVWPGIFIGNFSYNYYHLSISNDSVYLILFIAFCVAIGSTLQALFANYVIRRYSRDAYFHTVKDVFVFLIPGGIIACLIACSIGMVALQMINPLSWKIALSYWFTFWVGDTLGVFIFTPLVVVWSILSPVSHIKSHSWEILFMILFFFLISFGMPYFEFPIRFLYIPLLFWVAYRFGMHGATIGVFFVALSILIPATVGQYFSNLPEFQLLYTILFIETTVAVTLFIAALVNEKMLALHKLKVYEEDLLHNKEFYDEEIRNKNEELLVNEKLFSLGKLTSGMIKLLHVPLKRIGIFSKNSLDLLDPLEKNASYKDIKSNLESIHNFLSSIIKSEGQASSLVNVIQEQTNLTGMQKLKIQSIDLNQIINETISKATKEIKKGYPQFIFNVAIHFEKSIQMQIPVADDLSNALYYLFYYSIFSMKEKKDASGEKYNPELKVSTFDLEKNVEIQIQDNAGGIKGDKSFFSSFISSTPVEGSISLAEEPRSLAMALSNDIISHIYQGATEVNYSEGQYLHLKIILPKNSSP